MVAPTSLISRSVCPAGRRRCANAAISSFYGIVIAMYYRDHEPPHFHAIYDEFEAQVVIASLEVLSGELPPRALRLVQEWGSLHRSELEANWQSARAHEPLATIDPLP